MQSMRWSRQPRCARQLQQLMAAWTLFARRPAARGGGAGGGPVPQVQSGDAGVLDVRSAPGTWAVSGGPGLVHGVVVVVWWWWW
jgi:hypothetical protein